jgi:hypothetical protein
MDRGALDKFRASTGFGMGNVQNENTRRRNDMYSTFDNNAFSQRPAMTGKQDNAGPQLQGAGGPTMPNFGGTPNWQNQMYRNLSGRNYYGPQTQVNIPIPGAPGVPSPQVSVQQPQTVWGVNNLPAWAQNVQQNYNNMRNPQYARQFFGQGRRFGTGSVGGPAEPIGPVPPPDF